MAQELTEAVTPAVIAAGVPRTGMDRRELLLAAQAAWQFRETGRFPSEVVCEHRGFVARTPEGTETPESVCAWHDIATALRVSPTAYLSQLMSDPASVARGLLRARTELYGDSVS